MEKGTIKASDIDLANVDFAVDTALSWDGNFPAPGKGDYLVTIGDIDGEPRGVLVSRRYVEAIDHDNAAEIALDAYAERHGYESDNEGNILPLDEYISGTDKPMIPCWVERVDAVKASKPKPRTPEERTSERLRQKLVDLGEKPRSYSGRAMYGKTCLGVTTDYPGSLLPQLPPKARKEAIRDSMGMSTILYWPHLPWTGFHSA